MPNSSPRPSNEAFSRIKIDSQLRDVAWNLTDGRSARYEVPLPDGTKADYVLADRNGRSLAVIEAKRASVNPVAAESQAKAYAAQLQVPFIFLSNGEEIWFWEWQREAHPRPIKTFYTQEDLERKFASYQVRRDVMAVAIDNKIVERDYQHECINELCKEIKQGRRKLLVEMATGTGKTRTAAALIKRLFEANLVTRVLFLVDRITLAKQTEDAFAEYLPEYPAYVLRSGRPFDDAKRITITTLQSMVNTYADYSAGYFDLVISDECHRSIYGKWSGILKHFDGVQVGLTATPCIVDPATLDNLPDAEDKLFVRDTLKFFEVDKPTFSYGLKQAIAEGHLVPYQIYKAKTVKTASEDGFPVKRDELDWSAMDVDTKAAFEEAFGDKPEIIVDPNALERKFTIPERNRAMVREFRKVIEEGYVGKDGVKRLPDDGKTIVFAVTMRHAETLARMFDEAFADKKPSPEVRYADFVVSEQGAADTADAETRIKRFKKEAFPKVLVSVNMLDTGFDCPEVVNLIMARFTKSAILYQQMRGRGTRKADHIRKNRFTMFDFTGVTDFHGDNEDAPTGGFVIPTKPKTGPSQPRRLLVLDIHDHIDPATRAWVTLDENGNEIAAEAIEALKGERGAAFEDWFLSHSESLNAEQTRLLRMVGEQIRANADTLNSFDLARFVQPPFSTTGGIGHAIQVFGSEAALEQRLTEINSVVFGIKPN